MTVTYQNWLDVLDEVGAAGLAQLGVADLSALQGLLAEDEAVEVQKSQSASGIYAAFLKPRHNAGDQEDGRRRAHRSAERT